MGFEFYEERDFKDTELGPLPVDWKVVRLGEVAEIRQGKQLSSKEDTEGKIKMPFLRTSNVFWNKIDLKIISFMYFTEEEISKLKLKNGDVLICEGGDVGRTAVWEGQIENCSYQNHLHRVRVHSDKLLNYFLSFFMEYAVLHRQLLVSNANRTTIPNLSSSRLKQFPIPLPPLEEQKAIAEVLRSVQSAIEKTEEVIRATKELKKSMMKHLFTYGYVPVDEIDKVRLKETKIGFIPEHWKVVRLGEVAETFSGGTPRRDIKEYYGGNIKWLKSGELKDNFIFSTEETITPEGLKNSSAKYVDKGTLLIAMYGATAGKVGYAMDRLTINQAICAIKPKIADFHSLFYFYFFQKIRENILSLRYGGAQPNLNQQIISNLSIPLPPLEEQKAIGEVLRAIDEKLQKEEEYKKALQNLFKSLLHHLMSGKIRVRRTTN